jgi:hypothetical protein
MARLKLQSHQVKPFSGRSAEFPKWRSHTECVFNGTGYEQFLSNETYAISHPLKNALVFSQLSIALCDGDASHLVDQHRNTQNEHQAWHDLMTYFYGSNLASADLQSDVRTTTNSSSQFYKIFTIAQS